LSIVFSFAKVHADNKCGVDMITTLAPFAQYQDTLWSGAVEVFCFGDSFPGEKNPDWTLKYIKDRETFEQNVGNEDATIIRRLPEIGVTLGVRKFAAPSPIEFCGRIANPNHLTEEISWCGITVRRGVTADGCIVPVGEGYVLSAAGCAAIIARRRSDGEVIAAHAGLRSLNRAPDPGHVEFKNVVTSIVEMLGTDIDVQVVLPIDPEQFTYPLNHEDPVLAKKNRQRRQIFVAKYGHKAVPGPRAEGRNDIRHIIAYHFKREGTSGNRVKVGPTTKEVQGFYTTRDESPRNTRRNLILVVRRY